MGNFTSPAQMKQELSAFVTDGAFLDKMVAEYFRENPPAPTPTWSPLNKPKKDYGTSKNAIQREDESHEVMMANGSAELGQAIEIMLKGGKPKTSADLMWRSHPGSQASYHTDSVLGDGGYDLNLKANTYSGPCFRCGAARGCNHRG